MTLPGQIRIPSCRCSLHPPTGLGSCHLDRSPHVNTWSGAELRPESPSIVTHMPGTRSSVETASTTSPQRRTDQLRAKLKFQTPSIQQSAQRDLSVFVNENEDETVQKFISRVWVGGVEAMWTSWLIWSGIPLLQRWCSIYTIDPQPSPLPRLAKLPAAWQLWAAAMQEKLFFFRSGCWAFGLDWRGTCLLKGLSVTPFNPLQVRAAQERAVRKDARRENAQEQVFTI